MSIMKRLLLILILLLPQLLAAQSADRSAVQSVDRTAAQTADRIPANSAGRRTGREYAIRTVDRDSLGLDTLRRLDAMGGDLMTLRGDGREGSVVLEVAGFGLTLGRAPETDSQADLVMKSGRVKLYFFNSGEFGFTKLVGVDYGSYAPEEKGFLDQKLGNSFHCAASVMQVQVALNKSRTLCGSPSTTTGLRMPESAWATKRAVCCPWRWTNPPTNRNSSLRRWEFRSGLSTSRSNIFRPR